MNPSPDRGKECLPPKKRESRQGSSEQRPLEDDFKHPAPLRSRRQQVSEGRESGGDSRFDKDLLPPPPPPPPPLPPLSLGLPWQVPYQSSIHHPFLPSQAGERRGSGSPSWRDSGTEPPPIPHHSRWLRGDISPLGLQPPISVPTFKSAYAVESRDMWPYFGPTRREYSSSLFSSHHLFPQPSMYPPDLLSDSRLRYPSRRPNGLDGPGSRSESSSRLASSSDCGNDARSRLGGGSHSNGRKRHQEDLAGRSTGRGTLSQEGPNAHSFLQEPDRDPRTLGMPKPPNPHVYTSDSRTGKATAPHEPSSGSASQTGAQIYYSLGSLYSSVHQNPQALANLSPSGPPPSPLRNSQHSPHSQHNSHGTDQERELSPGSYRPSVSILSGPDPPPSAVLPHFAKGSLIELASGRLKRVEELRTEDFLHSADTSPEFHLSTCTILLISPGPADGFNHLQVLLADRNTQELLTVLEEYPFFVRDRGWSSCSPQRSAQLYGLPCRQLSTGDICLALTPTPTSASATSNRAHSRAQRGHDRTTTRSEVTQVSTHGAERMPPPPAPPPSTQIPPSDSQSQEKPRPRKRRWSAPELQAGDRTCLDLPQGCKRVRQQ
ncbi:lysine-specific demethylase 6B [Colossoma macropomum]|uniref:lysine-specific demethylase 6B n=1 Tax=Colossoma macropomum TaxID=42526 RepID=UPI0018646638|nr:lysine-specific demethylase 6B [Colossoma macropomum]XP_036447889.1 lysine-specific demethylase 6B [Colossoma macropomum]